MDERKLTLKAKALKKSSKTIKVLTVKGAKTKLTYKLISVKKAKFKKYFKVNSSTGRIKVNKKLKKVLCGQDSNNLSIDKTTDLISM